MLNKKRGLSAVVTTVIMIVLVLIAVMIIWGVVNNMIHGQLQGADVCTNIMGKVEFNPGYVCYNENTGYNVNINTGHYKTPASDCPTASCKVATAGSLIGKCVITATPTLLCTGGCPSAQGTPYYTSPTDGYCSLCPGPTECAKSSATTGPMVGKCVTYPASLVLCTSGCPTSYVNSIIDGYCREILPIYINETRVGINLKDIELESITIFLTGEGKTKSYEIYEGVVYPEVGLWGGYRYNQALPFPEKNSGLTYKIDTNLAGFTKRPSSISIAPKAQGKSCGEVAVMREIEDCSTLEDIR